MIIEYPINIATTIDSTFDRADIFANKKPHEIYYTMKSTVISA